MRTVYSPQYEIPAVMPGKESSPERIMAYCRKVGAIYHEGPDDLMFCIVLRDDIGPELWTERAIRGSVK